MEIGLFKINVYTPKILLTKQLVMASFCEFDKEMQNVTPSCFIIVLRNIWLKDLKN